MIDHFFRDLVFSFRNWDVFVGIVFWQYLREISFLFLTSFFSPFPFPFSIFWVWELSYDSSIFSLIPSFISFFISSIFPHRYYFKVVQIVESYSFYLIFHFLVSSGLSRLELKLHYILFISFWKDFFISSIALNSLLYSFSSS